MKEEIYRISQKSENKAIIRFSIAGTTFPDKNYRIHRPHSPTACLEYIEEGEGTVELDGKVFHPKAGDSYFLPPSKDHHYYADKDRPWKKHFINVSGKLLSSLVEGYGLSDMPFFEGLDLKEEILAMISLSKKEEDPTDALIALLNAAMLKMHRHLRKSADEKTDVERMKEFLDTQVGARFRMVLLCEHVKKSESQAIRIFKAAYGVTPYAYLLERKLSFSKKLLLDTTLSVAQIAEKLGFADEYYFSNIFKKKIGVCPSSFRGKY